MKDIKQKVSSHEYYRVLKEGGVLNMTFFWEGRRVILPHWDFVWALWETPLMHIQFKSVKITFEPPEDFELEFFLDALHAFSVTHVYQTKELKLDVQWVREDPEVG